MNCVECQDILQSRLDGLPITAEEALDRHLAQCPICRERHVAARGLLVALHAMARPSPPAGLAPRIAAAVVRDRQRRRVRMRRSLGVTAALAAAILVMLVVAYLRRPAFDGDKPDSLQIVKDGELPRNVPPVPPIADKPKGPANKDEGARTFAALTGRLADKTLDQAKVLWTVANPVEGVPMADLPRVDQLDPAAEPLRQAKQEVSESFQAVTHSARRAFDYFAREMPMFDMPPPEPK